MLAADIPAKFTIPFANTAGPGYIRPVPTVSQIGIHDGYASLADGFPPLNFLPVSSGGVPPFGQDMNGLLNQTTAWSRWMCAGGTVAYDGAFSSAVGGYPKGSVLRSTVAPYALYESLVDNNTTDPDATTAANWGLVGLIRLTANTTFYVRSDGNDANNGLANTAGGAFLTIQRAANVLSNLYHFNGFQVSINIGTNATYAGATFYPCVGQRSPILLTGLSTAGTIINTQMSVVLGVSVTFSTMKFAGGLNGIVSAGAAVVGAGCEFGTLVGSNTAHLYANGGGSISVSVPYTISGPASTHLQSFGGVIGIGGGGAMAITITGTPNFSNAFASFSLLGLVAFNFTGGAVTFVGGATGTRYSGGNLSCLDSSGSGASYLPGNAAGVLLGGAVYN